MSRKSKLAKKHRRLRRIAKIFGGVEPIPSYFDGSSLEHFITKKILTMKADNRELREQRIRT